MRQYQCLSYSYSLAQVGKPCLKFRVKVTGDFFPLPNSIPLDVGELLSSVCSRSILVRKETDEPSRADLLQFTPEAGIRLRSLARVRIQPPAWRMIERSVECFWIQALAQIKRSTIDNVLFYDRHEAHFDRLLRLDCEPETEWQDHETQTTLDLVDAVFNNAVFAVKSEQSRRLAALQRLRQWAQHQGHAQANAMTSIEVARILIQRGKSPTATPLLLEPPQLTHGLAFIVARQGSHV